MALAQSLEHRHGVGAVTLLSQPRRPRIRNGLVPGSQARSVCNHPVLPGFRRRAVHSTGMTVPETHPALPGGGGAGSGRRRRRCQPVLFLLTGPGLVTVPCASQVQPRRSPARPRPLHLGRGSEAAVGCWWPACPGPIVTITVLPGAVALWCRCRCASPLSPSVSRSPGPSCRAAWPSCSERPLGTWLFPNCDAPGGGQGVESGLASVALQPADSRLAGLTFHRHGCFWNPRRIPRGEGEGARGRGGRAAGLPLRVSAGNGTYRAGEAGTECSVRYSPFPEGDPRVVVCGVEGPFLAVQGCQVRGRWAQLLTPPPPATGCLGPVTTAQAGAG